MKITTAGTQKESKVIEISAETKQNPLLHYNIEYDSCHPEQTIRSFVMDIRSILSRYDGNEVRLKEIDDELQDLEHYIEIAPFKTVPNGYKLYRKLAELRRERRACKNENDLLRPLCTWFKNNPILDRLSAVQGDVAKLRETIDGRVYAIRTDILNEWTEPQEKKNETEVKVIEEEHVDIPVAQEAVVENEEAAVDMTQAARAKYQRVWSAAVSAGR